MTTEVLVRENAHNPLDLLEEILSANQWPFDRSSDDELVVECNGQWGSYQLHFSWSGDLSAMHFSSYMDMKVPKARRPTTLRNNTRSRTPRGTTSKTR